MQMIAALALLDAVHRGEDLGPELCVDLGAQTALGILAALRIDRGSNGSGYDRADDGVVGIEKGDRPLELCRGVGPRVEGRWKRRVVVEGWSEQQRKSQITCSSFSSVRQGRKKELILRGIRSS